MKERELFMDGITGRFFMENRENVVKLMEELNGKATIGGVAMALSALGEMPMPSRKIIGLANRYKMLGYRLVESKTDDGTTFTSINIQYK